MIQMSESISELATALSATQGELTAVGKSQSGYGYKYADLASTLELAKPILSKNGLAITQLITPSVKENTVGLTSVLMHSSGQYIQTYSEVPKVEMKGCNEAQMIGATISYLRRYQVQAMLGMASEDNDASSQGFSNNSSYTPKKAQESKPIENISSKEEAPKKTGGFRRTKVSEETKKDVVVNNDSDL